LRSSTVSQHELDFQGFGIGLHIPHPVIPGPQIHLRFGIQRGGVEIVRVA